MRALRRRILALGCLGFLAAAGSRAQEPVRVGLEFQVNTLTAGSQKYPAAAADADGDVVLVWETTSGGTPGISACRFSSAGAPLGSQFGINSTSITAAHPEVDATPSGSFVVVWATDAGSVFARSFDSSGLAQSGQITVAPTSGSQGQASVAVDAGGNFVVVWLSSGGLVGHRFDHSATSLAPEFMVNSYTDPQQFPVVRSEPDGDFVVVWQSGQDGSYSGIFGQRFASSGARVGVEFQVNTYTPGDQFLPALEVRADGSFLVAWSGDFQDGSYLGILAQRFDSSGAPSGEEFQVNLGVIGDQRYPSVDGDAGGRFVVAWQTDPKNNDLDVGVALRRFTSTGGSQSLDVRANAQATGPHRLPTVAGAEGRFVVAWEGDGDGDGAGIFAQRFRLLAAADVDGDGASMPLTDGLLLLRFGFGFTGNTLVSGAVGPNCTRCDASSIAAYLQSLF